MLPFLAPASPLPFRKLRRLLPRLEAALDFMFLLRITGVDNHCGVLMAGGRPGRSRPRGAGEHVVKGGGGINRTGRLPGFLRRLYWAISPLLAGLGV